MLSEGDICHLCNDSIDYYHDCGSYLDYHFSNEKFKLTIEYDELIVKRYLATKQNVIRAYTDGLSINGTFYYTSDIFIFDKSTPDKTVHQHLSHPPVWEDTLRSSSSWIIKNYHFNMIEILSSSNSLSDFYNNIDVYILFS